MARLPVPAQGTWAVTCGLSIAMVLGLSLAAAGQIPGTSSAPPSAAGPIEDPLGRDTPRGTIRGFNGAARSDPLSASLFMDLTPTQRESAHTLATQLNELIDRYFLEPMNSLSASRSGTMNDGLPLDRERIRLTTDEGVFDLELVQVTDPKAGPIWLISSGSLARVPAIYESAQTPWLERIMPRVLVNSRVLGLSLARWLAYAVSVALPLVVFWFLSFAFIAGVRLIVKSPSRRKFLELWYAGLRWLTVFVLTLGVHLVLIRYLGFSFRFRYVYSRFALVAVVIAGTWLLMRLLALSLTQARHMAERRGESGFSSLLMLAQRVGNVILTLVAIFTILSIAGVDTTTALAGLGIGGVAVALGAQKSVENLLGGVFLITDNALAVGDECRIADRNGRIEDITLRSIRLRTVEQTLLSIPAGALSQASIENFSTRGKILVQTRLRLGYETTVVQLRAVLESIRRLLEEHPRVETASSRIRLVDFGAQAVELELFAYILTSDMAMFLAVREELLLKIAEIIETSGTTFSRPTDFVYLEKPSLTSPRATAGESEQVVTKPQKYPVIRNQP